MSAEPAGLQITIMGREFRVACSEAEQKGLLEAVEYLNERMQEVRDRSSVIGLDRIAIMAALNITHEFLTIKVGGVDIAETRRRMKRMEASIDQAMARQNYLF